MPISVRNLSVEYTTGGYLTKPLDDLSFEAGAGELVVVLGAILAPAAGEVIVNDTDVVALRGAARAEYRRRGVGFVFQSFNLVSSLTAVENVAAPLRFAGTRGADALRRATALLERVDLGHRLTQRPGALSGGEQQRVAVARSLVHDPPLLLADEPTAHLDFIQVEGIVRLLRELAAGDRTVVVATHDHRLLPVGDRVVELTPQQPHVGTSPAAPVELSADEVLFRQGDPSDFVYMVLAGTVEVLRVRTDGGHERLATVGQGQYVGELGPLLSLPRSATARAAKAGAALRAMSASEFRAEAAAGMDDAHPRPLRLPGRVLGLSGVR